MNRTVLTRWLGTCRRALDAQHAGLGLPLRLATYCALWWILSGGEGGWLWGLPAVAAAALFNPFPRGARWRPRWSRVLLFIPVFCRLSLRSALDVAWRAVHPRRPLDPVLVDYPWQLPDEGGRVFLASLLTLMPGTLCARISARSMTVHIIGDAADRLEGIARLESRIARLQETG